MVNHTILKPGEKAKQPTVQTARAPAEVAVKLLNQLK